MPTMSDADTAGLIVVRHGGARLDLIVNRPAKRNALSRAVLADLRGALERHAEDPEIRVAVLRGAGDRSFAAGGDLRELSAVREHDEAVRMSRDCRAALDAVRSFPVPVVAALNGDALGGGAELAAACDLRVAAAHARIGFIQGRLAITTAWGGGIDLAAIVGPARALALIGRSSLLEPPEALAIGLVDAVAGPNADLESAVADFVRPMLALPRHVASAVKTLNRAVRAGASRADLERIETELFAQAWVHEDHWRAADAVLNRRVP